MSVTRLVDSLFGRKPSKDIVSPMPSAACKTEVRAGENNTEDRQQQRLEPSGSGRRRGHSKPQGVASRSAMCIIPEEDTCLPGVVPDGSAVCGRKRSKDEADAASASQDVVTCAAQSTDEEGAFANASAVKSWTGQSTFSSKSAPEDPTLKIPLMAYFHEALPLGPKMIAPTFIPMDMICKDARQEKSCKSKLDGVWELTDKDIAMTMPKHYHQLRFTNGILTDGKGNAHEIEHTGNRMLWSGRPVMVSKTLDRIIIVNHEGYSVKYRKAENDAGTARWAADLA